MPRANFFKSIGFAIKGIIGCVKRERNLRIHLVMATLVTCLGFIFAISKSDWLAVLLLFSIIFSAEVFNSAIEGICDLLKERLNLDYGATTFIRNVAAGAVLILTSFSVIIGLIIFLPYILAFSF